MTESFRAVLLIALIGLSRPTFGQSTVEKLIEAGRHKLDSGDATGAAAEFDRAVVLDPKDPRAYFARGVAKTKQGDLDGASADYTRAVEANPRFSQALINRGAIKWQKGDLDSALGDFNRAIDVDPNAIQALNARGVIKDAVGDQIGARTDYYRALQVNPDFLPTYGNRGQSYYLSRNWDAALADFVHASTAGMANQDYLQLYAWIIRMRKGAAETASRDLSAYLKRRKGDPTDWYSTVSNYLLGKGSEQELTAAGASAGDRQKECEMWFYIGMKSLLAGDRATALQDLHKCVDTGARIASEYLFAEAELKALEKPEN